MLRSVLRFISVVSISLLPLAAAASSLTHLRYTGPLEQRSQVRLQGHRGALKIDPASDPVRVEERAKAFERRAGDLRRKWTERPQSRASEIGMRVFAELRERLESALTEEELLNVEVPRGQFVPGKQAKLDPRGLRKGWSVKDGTIATLYRDVETAQHLMEVLARRIEFMDFIKATSESGENGSAVDPASGEMIALNPELWSKTRDELVTSYREQAMAYGALYPIYRQVQSQLSSIVREHALRSSGAQTTLEGAPFQLDRARNLGLMLRNVTRLMNSVGVSTDRNQKILKAYDAQFQERLVSLGVMFKAESLERSLKALSAVAEVEKTWAKLKKLRDEENYLTWSDASVRFLGKQDLLSESEMEASLSRLHDEEAHAAFHAERARAVGRLVSESLDPIEILFRVLNKSVIQPAVAASKVAGLETTDAAQGIIRREWETLKRHTLEKQKGVAFGSTLDAMNFSWELNDQMRAEMIADLCRPRSFDNFAHLSKGDPFAALTYLAARRNLSDLWDNFAKTVTQEGFAIENQDVTDLVAKVKELQTERRSPSWVWIDDRAPISMSRHAAKALFWGTTVGAGGWGIFELAIRLFH